MRKVHMSKSRRTFYAVDLDDAAREAGAQSFGRVALNRRFERDLRQQAITGGCDRREFGMILADTFYAMTSKRLERLQPKRKRQPRFFLLLTSPQFLGRVEVWRQQYRRSRGEYRRAISSDRRLAPSRIDPTLHNNL